MRLSNYNPESVYGQIAVVSFTGTRRGMTDKQLDSFRRLIKKMKASTLVHGDCVGADEEAGEEADGLGMAVHLRPSTAETRAFSKVGTVIAKPEPPLDRNQDIVDDGDCLVACPCRMQEELHSGTWAAVRYARKQDYLIFIVWPDGSFTWPLSSGLTAEEKIALRGIKEKPRRKKTCTKCQGRGKNVPLKGGKTEGPTGPWKKCNKCKGKGYIRASKDSRI